MQYQPSQKILRKYAELLVRFALGNGKGIKKGDVVYLVVPESAKPFYLELRRSVLRAGGHIISHYLPNDEKRLNPSRDFFQLASKEQLGFFPRKYFRGLIEQIDHSIGIISEVNKKALRGIDPKRIMLANQAVKPFRDWRNEKENKGKFSWVLALYGTPQMAREASLSFKEYWREIIKACFLDEDDPIKKWETIAGEIALYKNKLNNLSVKKIHIEGKDVSLWLSLGEKRVWQGGTSRNIPSFEIFTAPDWRGTEGWIKFNQPVYRYGNLIEGIELVFEKGKVVKSKAGKNEKLLKELLKIPGGDRMGEFSLTDSRFSRITKFMAEILFDENMGGKHGNMHLALGQAYYDCYAGKPDKVSKREWQELGFNEAATHTDIISTTERMVTVYLKDGSKKIIYKKGRFLV